MRVSAISVWELFVLVKKGRLELTVSASTLGVELAAEEPARRADQQRHHQVDAGCRETNDHRNACPVDDSAEDVAPQLVGTQPVLP